MEFLWLSQAQKKKNPQPHTSNFALKIQYWAFFLQMGKDVSWNNKLAHYRLMFKMAAPEKKKNKQFYHG